MQLRKVKWAIYFAVFALALYPIHICAASKSDEALKALKKFEARCEVGISYIEYSSALADVQFQAKAYFDNNDEGANPDLELARCLVDALADYRAAGIMWNFKVGLNYDDVIGESSDLWKDFIKTFPDGVQLLQPGSSQYGAHAYFPSMLSYVWEQASQKIDRASLLIKPARRSKK
jgi:hypothetical protein